MKQDSLEAAQQDSLELPLLPDTELRFAVRVTALGERMDYTADQLRAYARAAQALALERAAQECDQINSESGCGFETFAAAIRALKGKL